MSISKRTIVISVALMGLARATALHAQDNPDAVAYQNDPAHDGSITFQNFSATPKKLWSVDLGNLVSYPLIAQGEVYVTAANYPQPGMTLYALNAKTGHTDSSAQLDSTTRVDSAAYDNGKVFVVNSVSEANTMNAYDAATGAPLWSTVMPGQGFFSSPPTADNGVVYTGGLGNLYALNESTGATLWSAPVETGDISSPTVTGDGVYVSYSGPQAYKFDLAGGLDWHYSGISEGGGGKTAVFSDGALYIRDFNTPLLALDGATGNPLGGFVDNFNYTGKLDAPAFANGIGYATWNGALNAFDPATGAILWTKGVVGDAFAAAPIVVNGVVFEGTVSGKLYEYDGATGNQVGSVTNVGAGINGPDEQDLTQPLGGIGAGDGLLVVPAGTTVNAYSLTVPEPSSIVLAAIGAALATLAYRRKGQIRS